MKCLNRICMRWGANFESGSLSPYEPKIQIKRVPYKREKYYQALFELVLSPFTFLSYPEPKVGNGNVDFLISHNSTQIVIELKLSTNRNYEDNFLFQIRDYMKRTNTKLGIFLFIIEKEKSKKRTKKKSTKQNIPKKTKQEYLTELQTYYTPKVGEDIDIVCIDARPVKKPSDKHT